MRVNVGLRERERERSKNQRAETIGFCGGWRWLQRKQIETVAAVV